MTSRRRCAPRARARPPRSVSSEIPPLESADAASRQVSERGVQWPAVLVRRRKPVEAFTAKPRAGGARCGARSARSTSCCSASARSSAPGIFVLTGVAAREARRSGRDRVLRGGGRRLRARRALLRGVRDAAPDQRQRLQLLVRDARRAGRVDHRLGPGARVRARRRARSPWAGRATSGTCWRAAGSRSQPRSPGAPGRPPARRS